MTNLLSVRNYINLQLIIVKNAMYIVFPHISDKDLTSLKVKDDAVESFTPHLPDDADHHGVPGGALLFRLD